MSAFGETFKKIRAKNEATATLTHFGGRGEYISNVDIEINGRNLDVDLLNDMIRELDDKSEEGGSQFMVTVVIKSHNYQDPTLISRF